MWFVLTRLQLRRLFPLEACMKPLVVVENGEAGPSFTSPDEADVALIDSSVGNGRLPTDDGDIESLHAERNGTAIFLRILSLLWLLSATVWSGRWLKAC